MDQKGILLTLPFTGQSAINAQHTTISKNTYQWQEETIHKYPPIHRAVKDQPTSEDVDHKMYEALTAMVFNQLL